MKTIVKKLTRRVVHQPTRAAIRPPQSADAAATIRQLGIEWARYWNEGNLDRIVAAYTEDAVYLPPHHPAVHGREAIREYLLSPQKHGVSELAFDVTYIKQSGAVAWDVGTYRMSVPQNDRTIREDHGKYVTIWQRIGEKWLIVADAWSSDVPIHEPHSTVGLA